MSNCLWGNHSRRVAAPDTNWYNMPKDNLLPSVVSEDRWGPSIIGVLIEGFIILQTHQNVYNGS